MFDFRYHVASLAAVFLALVIGILVGVGISGRGFVDKSERNKLEARIDRLQARVDELSRENDSLRNEQQAGRAFMTDAYPVLMSGRLTGKRVAVIVVGAPGSSAASNSFRALDDAGAAGSRYRALKLPVAAGAVKRALVGYDGSPQLGDLGRTLAQEWVSGGRTPVSDALTPVLVEEQRGTSAKPADGVVVVQTEPPRGTATKRFLDGLYGGLGSAGIPVVAVEESGLLVSTVPQFDAFAGFSTVDDVDTPSGRLALALVLAGAAEGNYGVKQTASAPLPKIEPTPAP